jgi:hypothetical protein
LNSSAGILVGDGEGVGDGAGAGDGVGVTGVPLDPPGESLIAAEVVPFALFEYAE